MAGKTIALVIGVAGIPLVFPALSLIHAGPAMVLASLESMAVKDAVQLLGMFGGAAMTIGVLGMQIQRHISSDTAKHEQIEDALLHIGSRAHVLLHKADPEITVAELDRAKDVVRRELRLSRESKR